jgi:di/tricarboxylate transporter
MDQYIVFATLLMALVLFTWGRIRHDFVAMIALFVVVVAGIIDPTAAFEGFGHPAVITVAAVLIMGKGLESSGLVDLLSKWALKAGSHFHVQLLILTVMAAFASAFINNVGALAIMMPIAIQLVRKSGHSPSHVLMPLAFASLLGGMTTMIGTPPNIIIATFRGDELGAPFGMFDFSPVGIPLAIAGVSFLTLIGWRLLPKRETPKSVRDLFDIDDYITEVEVVEGTPAEGKTIIEFVAMANVSMQILGVIRNEIRIHAPDPGWVFNADDVLIIETDADELKAIIENTGVRLIGEGSSMKDAVGTSDIIITEAVVMADSPLIGRTVMDVELRRKHNINLLAVARKESRIHLRLADIVFRNGDVLLLQGRERTLQDKITSLGCLPLARRGLDLGYNKRVFLALGIFMATVVIVVTGALHVSVAFSMAAVAMVLSGVLPVKEIYKSVDWPVIVLLGAMIPVGVAMETTGGAATIANAVLSFGAGMPPWVIIAVVLAVTMIMSDLINNAATVLLMAPIAIGLAKGLGFSVDPLLMAVAYGGSSAFLTPIGHQSNTLVMAPGGYRFTDYTRMGLPLEIILIVLGVPLILWFFPV